MKFGEKNPFLRLNSLHYNLNEDFENLQIQDLLLLYIVEILMDYLKPHQQQQHFVTQVVLQQFAVIVSVVLGRPDCRPQVQYFLVVCCQKEFEHWNHHQSLYLSGQNDPEIQVDNWQKKFLVLKKIKIKF